jgi:hypothetical protein
MIEGTNLAHWIDSITFKTLLDSPKKEVVAKTKNTSKSNKTTENKKVISQTQPWAGT